jgi:hypothetical protein
MATEQQLTHLEWLAERSRKVLEDPKKQKWHADTRAQLAQIEAEIERLQKRERAAAPASLSAH